MSAPSGWYDDPRDPLLLRYWDGVLWTDHTAPKVSPTAAQSHIGEAHHVPTPPMSHGQRPAYGQMPPHQPMQPQQPSAAQPAWQQGTGGYTNAPQWQQPGRLGAVTTPDGAQTSGWWRRFLARVLDGLIVSVISLPVTGWFYWQYLRVFRGWFATMLNDAEAGRQSTSMMLPSSAYTYIIPAVLIQLAVYALYEVLFVTRTGATPGKMAAGISVRLRDVAGPPPALAVLKRLAVLEGPSLLSFLPFIGTLLGLFQIVDVLWPLWDPRHQALHDKFAGTNVVLGKQERQGSGGSSTGGSGVVGSSGLQDRPTDQIGSSAP